MNTIPTGANQIAAMKGGRLLQSGGNLYFLSRRSEVFIYPESSLDYLMEWGQRDLRPDQKNLDLIKSIHHFFPHQHPVSCSFRNGIASDYCVIEFIDYPPLKFTYDWYYYDMVGSVSVSPKVVSNEMVALMKTMKKKKDRMLQRIQKLKGNLLDNPAYYALLENTDVVVQDNHGELYKFSEPTTFLYYSYLDVSQLNIISSPTDEQVKKARLLSIDWLEYERKDYVEPVKTIFVYADLM